MGVTKTPRAKRAMRRGFAKDKINKTRIESMVQSSTESTHHKLHEHMVKQVEAKYMVEMDQMKAKLKTRLVEMDQMKAKLVEMDQMKAKLAEMDQMKTKLVEMDQMKAGHIVEMACEQTKHSAKLVQVHQYYLEKLTKATQATQATAQPTQSKESKASNASNASKLSKATMATKTAKAALQHVRAKWKQSAASYKHTIARHLARSKQYDANLKKIKAMWEKRMDLIQTKLARVQTTSNHFQMKLTKVLRLANVYQVLVYCNEEHVCTSAVPADMFTHELARFVDASSSIPDVPKTAQLDVANDAERDLWIKLTEMPDACCNTAHGQFAAIRIDFE